MSFFTFETNLWYYLHLDNLQGLIASLNNVYDDLLQAGELVDLET